MATALKVIGIILIILIVLLVILYILGSRLQNEQIEQEQLLDNAKQLATILTIDKKQMKYKDAGLPALVYEQAPKRMSILNPKIPIVKAKIGQKIVNLICDPAIFEVIPIKSECKVEISGIYITALKTVRGKAIVVPKKKGFKQKLNDIVNRGKEERKAELGLTTDKKKKK